MIRYREALVSDIPQIMIVRLSVKENVLSDPSLVTQKDNEEYITIRGKGWIAEINNSIVGFAIADLKEHSIWALFVSPENEGKGIGKTLHGLILNWYFNSTKENVWLTTAAFTRAEKFYKSSGWIEIKREQKQPSLTTLPDYTEIKLEMSYDRWHNNKTT